MRQEITHLVHQVDTQCVVIDADVHMHATDDETPRGGLHLHRQLFVAIFFRVLLLDPAAERMRRRRYRRKTMTVRDFDDDFPETGEILARLLHVLADLGTNLDLRAEQL